MPESLSASALAGYAALHARTIPGSAVSREAALVHSSVCSVTESLERSMALFGAKSAALSELFSLADEFPEGGWDGGGEKPVSPWAIRLAAAFVRALPDRDRLPEFAAEPDGSISLDWIESRDRVFSISLGNSSRISYAWLDGIDKGHGVASFYGDRIPPRILEAIRLLSGGSMLPSPT